MGHPFRHLALISRHKWRVLRNCFQVGLYWQGLVHDCSKWSWTEFAPGARFYQGSGSPINQERKQLGVSYAWLHHKGRNKHHPEYWTDYDEQTHQMVGVPMPLRYVLEAVCDRMAASRVYAGQRFEPGRGPLDFYLQNRDLRTLHPETDQKLQEYISLWQEQGEAICLQQMRRDWQDQKHRNAKHSTIECTRGKQ